MLNAAELRALRVIDNRAVAVKVLVLGLGWAGLGALVLATDVLWQRVLLWIGMGFVINGFIQLWHDSWHRTVFSSVFFNDLLGHSVSFAVGVMFTPSRDAHLLHHKHNRTFLDPDAYNAGKKNWRLYVQYYMVTMLGLALSPLHFNLAYPFKFYGKPALWRHMQELLGYALAYAAVAFACIALGVGQQALLVWIIPVWFASPWMGLKSVSDHYRNTWRGDRFHTATTVRSNFVVTYLWNGLNYHLEHHLYPFLPGYRLPAVHERLRSELLEKQSPIFSSYLGVFAGALRDGPLIIDEDTVFTRVQRRALG